MVVITLFLLSCQNGVGKKRKIDTNKEKVPSIEREKIEKPIPQLQQPGRNATPFEKQVKKKRLKAIDTLKPLKAIP